MALKCSRCGEEAEETRFYCASCGHELQPTDRRVETPLVSRKNVQDIDSRAITVALMGVAVAIVGFFAYGFGMLWGAYGGADAWLGLPGLIMTSGFCMIGAGIFLNWSQDLPRSVRIAGVIEMVFAIVSFTVLAALTMEVTSWAWVTSETGELLYKAPVYGHQDASVPLLIPLVLGPAIIVFGIWMASRLAWAGGLVLSIVIIPLMASVLPAQAGNVVTGAMIGIQVLFLIAVLGKALRVSFKRPRKAKAAPT